MKLSFLLEDISSLIVSPSVAEEFADMEVVFLETDSRNVQKGSVFVVISGHMADGHDYISDALKNGSQVVVAEKIPEDLQSTDAESRILLVTDTRKALASLAARFYGYPSKDLVLVGITGTNGKTTTSYLLESIFTACGFVPAVMGTVNVRYQGKNFPSPTTTPGSLEIQRYLFQMKQAGVTHVIMEVSSHGIHQHRVDSCLFDTVVFTNLTQDHLDYHLNMDSYFACKKELFTRIMADQSSVKTGFSVINQDQEYGKRLVREVDLPVVSVSAEDSHASLYAEKISETINGLSFRLKTENGKELDFHSPLTGRFNLQNILCALGVAHGLGIDPECVKEGVSRCSIVPGRLQKVANDLGRHVFVDYAHTPDALKNVLKTLEKNVQGRLICVVGCGGDRDKTKRPLMGNIAVQYSDIAIITSDNPRTENPDSIIQDIVKDLPETSALSPGKISSETRGYLVEADRRKALNLAIRISEKEDIILVAGKGHETYQIIGSEKIYFDDTEELILACQRYQEIVPMDWSIADIVKALEKQAVSGGDDPDKRFCSVSTDSRMIQKGQLFVALKGKNFDGHKFIDQVLKKGGSGLILDESFSLPSHIRKNSLVTVFQVSDTTEALGKLAHFQRMRSKAKVIAITGSNGKTSTKDIIKSILEPHFPTLATKGNLNNEIGVPLTLLGLSCRHKWAVVEMGMNHPGEIRRLSAIAKPDMAIITNTGAAHLEGLGSTANVAKAKAEIFEHVNKGAVAILPGQDEQKQILVQAAEENSDIGKIVFFGGNEDASLQAENIKETDDICRFDVPGEKGVVSMEIHSPCQFMVTNALIGVIVGRLAGLDMGEIRKGIQQFSPVPGRMNLILLPNRARLIDDTYNANPKSMTAALTTLASKTKTHSCCLVLGDMMELGNHTNQAHYDLGRIAVMAGVSRLFLFGKMVELTRQGAIDSGLSQDKIFWGSKEDIALRLADVLSPDQWVLVKGSRMMEMETVISQLIERIKEKMKNESDSGGHGGADAV